MNGLQDFLPFAPGNVSCAFVIHDDRSIVLDVRHMHPVDEMRPVCSDKPQGPEYGFILGQHLGHQDRPVIRGVDIRVVAFRLQPDDLFRTEEIGSTFIRKGNGK